MSELYIGLFRLKKRSKCKWKLGRWMWEKHPSLVLSGESQSPSTCCSPIVWGPEDMVVISQNPAPSYWPDAAKSLQSCPTPCDAIDGRPPGSPIPGILQARTLEWGAVAFSNIGQVADVYLGNILWTEYSWDQRNTVRIFGGFCNKLSQDLQQLRAQGSALRLILSAESLVR